MWHAAHPDDVGRRGGEHACGGAERCQDFEAAAELVAWLALAIPTKIVLVWHSFG